MSPSKPYRVAQARIVDAALDLFAEHGVNGTSLQMIADTIGVTKAAIYHQFRTKDEIVFAAIEVELAKLETALDAAEAEASPHRAREMVLAQVIDAAVARRRMVSAVQHDPVVVRFLAKHEPFRQLMTRLYSVLTNGNVGAEARVRARRWLRRPSAARSCTPSSRTSMTKLCDRISCVSRCNSSSSTIDTGCRSPMNGSQHAGRAHPSSSE